MITYITLNKKEITDFAFERNELLKKAKTEWVFFLDSDEIITPELREDISRQIENNIYNGFYVKRKIIFLNQTIGEDRVLRLARKNSGKWKRAVHEVWDVEGNIGTLKGFLIHNTAHDLHSYINKINKYSIIHAEENLKEGKRSNIFKIIVYPILKFIQNFIQGRGFVFSMLQSFHSFLGWTQLWILQRG